MMLAREYVGSSALLWPGVNGSFDGIDSHVMIGSAPSSHELTTAAGWKAWSQPAYHSIADGAFPTSLSMVLTVAVSKGTPFAATP